MPDSYKKLVQVNGLGVVEFPGEMPDDKIAATIKKHKAQTHSSSPHFTGKTTEESEHARQLKPAQPLDTAIPKLPDWATRPLLSEQEMQETPEAQRKTEQSQAAFTAEHPKIASAIGKGDNPAVLGVLGGAKDFMHGMTSPANLALMVGAPESKLLSAFFSMQALKGSYRNAQEAQDAYLKGNNTEAIKYATEALLGAGIAGLAGHHAVKDIPVPEPIRKFVADETGSVTNPLAPKIPDVKAKAAELKPTTAYKSADQSQPFYLKSENLINEKMKGPMPAEDVHKMLLSNGVKPEEMKWTGLDELLQGKGKQKVTPQEIQEHLAGNNLQVHEVTKGTVDNRSKIENLDKQIADVNQRFAQSQDKNERDSLWKQYQSLTEERRNIPSSETLGGGPKFGSYVLPGGENYRELLVTMPDNGTVKIPKIKNYTMYDEHGTAIAQGSGEPSQRTLDNLADHPNWRIERGEQNDPNAVRRDTQNFRSSHWDEPNVLGHVRFNDRTGPNGEKILHMEELQSDWGQHIRSEGVKKSPAELAKLPMKANRENGFWEIYTGDGQFVGNVQDWDAPKVKTEEDAIKEARRRIVEEPHKTRIANKGLPDMPFKKTEDWAGLLFKRMMRHAAENGYDGISWTPGDEQVTRYPNLAEVTDRLMYDPKTETLRTFKYDNNEQQSFNIPKEKLSDHIGKEATQRLLNSPLEEGEHVLEGDGLITGGKGQRVFYDTMVPQIANKLGKQWGTKVGETTIDIGDKYQTDEDGYQLPIDGSGKTTVPYLPITPQMRAGVKSIPYSLFSIPLAAGALGLSQVKAKAQELQDKQKKTGVTQ